MNLLINDTLGGLYSMLWFLHVLGPLGWSFRRFLCKNPALGFGIEFLEMIHLHVFLARLKVFLHPGWTRAK